MKVRHYVFSIILIAFLVIICSTIKRFYHRTLIDVQQQGQECGMDFAAYYTLKYGKMPSAWLRYYVKETGYCRGDFGERELARIVAESDSVLDSMKKSGWTHESKLISEYSE